MTILEDDGPDYDSMVYAVQHWLNETYGGVEGFNEVDENGRTGWSTVYALTRALQHELGITALSNNFGPATLAGLSAQYPSIGVGASNTNIVRIVQGGLYCKGYNPNGFDGSFGNGCAAAVKQLKQDMGYPSSTTGNVIPKVFKGLLTMDAYVLLPGGTAAIRQVQQWLNVQYLVRADFFIMPCDGLYSRGVQRNLVYAIQYEIGMDDATANGTVGPATRSGLNTHGTFGVGASDGAQKFVSLFHAALIFNQVGVPFNGVFSASDSVAVSEFQDFCKLDVNGTADYRTWCSLLVSNGDPNRPGTACDTSVQITADFAEVLGGLGYQTVGRYLTNARVENPLDKEIKPGELLTIFAAGLSAFPIYQEVGAAVANFSYAAGVDAGYRADRAARSLGIPQGTTIYFAVDFDPTGEQITAAVVPHFRGINQALTERDGRFAAGAYGTRNVCQTLADTGLSRYSFVAGMSTGYSGNLGYRLPSNWSFDQIYEYTPAPGLPLDKDIKSGRDQGFSTTVISPPIAANADLLDYLLWLQVKAEEHIQTTGNTFRTPEVLVCQMMRYHEYEGIDWDEVAGTLDQDWIDFVEAEIANAGITPVTHYLDHTQASEPDPVTFDCAHPFVGIECYMHRGYPVEHDGVSENDVASWAGDLLSVLNAYQWSVDHGYGGFLADYAALTVGRDVAPSETMQNRFSFTDLCQDADGYNIARTQVEGQGSSFAELVVHHLNTGGPSSTRNRFAAFLEDRFGSPDNLRRAARQAFNLTVIPPSPLYLARMAALLTFSDPPVRIGDYDESQLDSVAQAFAQRVEDLT